MNVRTENSCTVVYLYAYLNVYVGISVGVHVVRLLPACCLPKHFSAKATHITLIAVAVSPWSQRLSLKGTALRRFSQYLSS